MKNHLLYSKLRLCQISRGNLRIVLTCLMYITASGCANQVAAEDLKETDATNRIFMRGFSCLLAVGNGMQTVLGVDPSNMSLTRETSEARSIEIRQLSVAEKSRLTLLYLLAYNIDGDKGYLIGKDLGDDKVHVAEALSRITDRDFKTACRQLGVSEGLSEGRVKVFRVLVNEWRSDDKKPKGKPSK